MRRENEQLKTRNLQLEAESQSKLWELLECREEIRILKAEKV